MKLTNEILKQMIMEELERLDEKNLPLDVTGFSQQDFLDNIFTSGGRKKTPSKNLPQADYTALAGLDGTATDLTAADYKAADPNSTIIKVIKTHGYKKHRDAAATAAGTTSTGSYGSFANISTFKKAADLYAASKTAAQAIIADSTDADAKFALAQYLSVLTGNLKGGNLKKKLYTGGKAKISTVIKTAANKTGKQNWSDIISALLGTNSSPNAATTIANAVLQDIDATLTAYEPQDITRPEMASVGGENAQQDQALISAFSALFEGANTMADRVKILNNVSDAMVNGNAKDIDTLFGTGRTAKRKLLNAIVCMDYIAKWAKEVDDRAGAYYFENFCALIGGSKMDGGSNGSGDFRIAATSGDLAGSSKFLSSGASTQAVSGFQNSLNTPVMYFYAKKKGGPVAKKTALEIWNFEITFQKVDRKVNKNNVATITGDGVINKFTKSTPTSKKGNVKIEFAPSGPATFVIELAKTKNDSFKQSLEAELVKADAGSRDAYNKMRDYFSQTRKADNGIKAYLASDDVNDGSAALQALAIADENMEDLLKDLSPAGTITGTGKNRQLAENENNLDKVLDKLIKEVILNK